MNKKILIVAANYYPKVTSNLILAAKRNILLKSKSKITLIKVPGIFEIPMVISKNINRFNGFIALGSKVKHHILILFLNRQWMVLFRYLLNIRNQLEME